MVTMTPISITLENFGVSLANGEAGAFRRGSSFSFICNCFCVGCKYGVGTNYFL